VLPIGLILVVVVSLVIFAYTEKCFSYDSVSNPVPRDNSFVIVIWSCRVRREVCQNRF
jgi:hypothetical protein